MKDFEPKLIVSKGFLDWLNLSGSDPLKTIIHSPIKFFWFLYNKDEREGAHMKDFDQKLIVPKGFWDWLTIKNRYSLSNPIFRFLHIKDGLEGAHMKDFDQKIFVSKGFLDWLTLSGSDPLKTVIHSSILFTGFI